MNIYLFVPRLWLGSWALAFNPSGGELNSEHQSDGGFELSLFQRWLRGLVGMTSTYLQAVKRFSATATTKHSVVT